MKIILSTKGRSGTLSRTIRVQTNDPKRRSVSLVCKANLLVPVKTDPKLANFGKLPRDEEPHTMTVKILRGDGGPLKPELEPIREQNISAKLRELTPGEEYALDVTISPPWPNTRLRGTITLKTGLPESPTHTVRVFAQFDPRLKAVPGRFMIPPERTEDLDVRVNLVWSGTPGNVKRVICSDPKLQVRTEGVSTSPAIVLHVPVDYQTEGRVRPTVTVYTDDPVARDLRIPVYVSSLGKSRPSIVPAGPNMPPQGQKAQPNQPNQPVKPAPKPTRPEPVPAKPEH